jgi:hypothetical protein
MSVTRGRASLMGNQSLPSQEGISTGQYRKTLTKIHVAQFRVTNRIGWSTGNGEDLHSRGSFFGAGVGMRLGTLGTPATNWPIVPAPDDDECEAVGE